MMFGYANGTDSVIDISIYLEKYNNHQINDFFNFLKDNMAIENNLFEYFPENKINLISIPQEILIFEINNNEETLLYNNSLMQENDNIRYVMKENKELIKTSKLYTIYYQYLLDENWPEWSRLRTMSSSEDRSKIYYGRINRLKFKLCHEYCETCYELSIDNNCPKCLSCQNNYQCDNICFENNSNEITNRNKNDEFFFDSDDSLEDIYKKIKDNFIQVYDGSKV